MFCFKLSVSDGTQRSHHGAVCVENKVYSFGGGKDQMEVHVFNTVSLRWAKPVAPYRLSEVPSTPKRRNLSTVLIDGLVYIWGGFPRCNELYAFDVDDHSWSKPRVSGAVPEARRHHSACVLDRAMYVHGGSVRGTGYTNDTYKFDTVTMVWSLVVHAGGCGGPTSPPASKRHSATVIGTRMFVFGGKRQHLGLTEYLDEVRVFDTETNLWLSMPAATTTTTGPMGRLCHSAFAYAGDLYVHGGYGIHGQTLHNDLWKYRPDDSSWTRIETRGMKTWDVSRHTAKSGKTRPGLTRRKRRKSRPAGLMHAMCCCTTADGDRVVFLGWSAVDIVDLSPSLRMLCKRAVLEAGLDQSQLPHNLRWELATMATSDGSGSRGGRTGT